MDTAIRQSTPAGKSVERRQLEEMIVLLRELRSEYAILYHSQGCPLVPRHLAQMLTRIDALINKYQKENLSCSQ